MTLTLVTAALGAIFAGVLAFKAFANKKPALFTEKNEHRQSYMRLFNPNSEHVVFISHFINTIPNEEFLISIIVNGKIVYQFSLSGEISAGFIIKPGAELVVSIGRPEGSLLLPIRSGIERHNFNFFATVPSFVVTIRPPHFKTRLEWVGGLIKKPWQGIICRYGPLKDEADNAIPYAKYDPKAPVDKTDGDAQKTDQ